MKLYINLSNGIPAPLARAYAGATVETAFRLKPDGDRCGRCNNDLREHWWQLVDPDQADQNGVFDCEVTA